MTVRRLNQHARAAMQTAGSYWLAEFFPLHFKPGAIQRYRYSPRKRSTHRRKFFYHRMRTSLGVWVDNPNKGKVPSMPWVWSGELRHEVFEQAAAMTRGRNRTLYPTSTSTKGPAVAIHLRYPHMVRAQFAGELIAVTPEEATVLRGVAQAEFNRLVIDDMGLSTDFAIGSATG